MSAISIAATGAKPGDKVKCVGLTPTAPQNGWYDQFHRFQVGQTYHVVDFNGIPSAHSGMRPHVEGGKPMHLPAFRGYGYLWEAV